MANFSRLDLSLQVLASKDGVPESFEAEIDYGFFQTPIGRVLLGETEGRVCYLAFAPAGLEDSLLSDLSTRWPGVSLNSNQQRTGRTLMKVFATNKAAEPAIRLLVRGTSFQVQVWKALLQIPLGAVRSYAEVAQIIGRPKAVRAVGSAVGANPIAWLIPCHRVIRSDGQLGGYRWGIEAKKACLEYEKQYKSKDLGPPAG